MKQSLFGGLAVFAGFVVWLVLLIGGNVMISRHEELYMPDPGWHRTLIFLCASTVGFFVFSWLATIFWKLEKDKGNKKGDQ